MSTLEIAKEIKWSDKIEEYLAMTAERSYCYGLLHKLSEAEFSKKRTYIDIPVIIGSTIAGTLSIGNQSLFGEENEKLAGICIGTLSLVVGVLSTINTYFGFAKRAENHRLTSIQFSKLYRFIQIELSLPRRERMMCADLLKIVREQYERLQEISPLIPDHILEDFKKRFKDYTDISKPSEANGLEAVVIYKEEVDGAKIHRSASISSLVDSSKSVDDLVNEVIEVKVEKAEP